MTNYPANLDDSSTIPVESAATPLSINHVIAHQNIQDAIEAIEAKVGVDSSAVTTSHDYKLSGVATGDKAMSLTGTEVTTNKTFTSPVVNVGSDATGDMYYRNAGVLTRIPVGSDNQIMKLNGTTPNWEAESTTVDASTTVKGVVEAATSAEVTAGTATGDTGAVLVVTPDALAASTPVFNGSGITNISGKANVTTSDTTLASSTSETTILTQSITGGTLSTANALRASCYVTSLQVSGTANTCTIRFKYGATTLVSKVLSTNATQGAGTNYAGKIEFVLMGSGATGTQEGVAYINFGSSQNAIGNAASSVSGYQALIATNVGTSSEDSTAAKTLAITVQFSNSGGSDNITVTQGMIEKIK